MWIVVGTWVLQSDDGGSDVHGNGSKHASEECKLNCYRWSKRSDGALVKVGVGAGVGRLLRRMRRVGEVCMHRTAVAAGGDDERCSGNSSYPLARGSSQHQSGAHSPHPSPAEGVEVGVGVE